MSLRAALGKAIIEMGIIALLNTVDCETLREFEDLFRRKEEKEENLELKNIWITMRYYVMSKRMAKGCK